MKRISFKIRKDENASPTRRFVLSVMNGDVCIIAPRYSFLKNALEDVDTFIREHNVGKCKVSIEL